MKRTAKTIWLASSLKSNTFHILPRPPITSEPQSGSPCDTVEIQDKGSQTVSFAHSLTQVILSTVTLNPPSIQGLIQYQVTVKF